MVPMGQLHCIPPPRSKSTSAQLRARATLATNHKLVQDTLATTDAASMEVILDGTTQVDAGALAEVGFDALGLSNNHAYDRGPEGLADTIQHLRAVGIEPFGAGMDGEEAAAPLLVETPCADRSRNVGEYCSRTLL